MIKSFYPGGRGVFQNDSAPFIVHKEYKNDINPYLMAFTHLPDLNQTQSLSTEFQRLVVSMESCSGVLLWPNSLLRHVKSVVFAHISC